MIESINPDDSPLQRYKQLNSIVEEGDVIFLEARSGLREKDMAIFDENVVMIQDLPQYHEAWQKMSKDNRTKFRSFPTEQWMINEDTTSVNTIFMIERDYQTLIPYNIDCAISISTGQNDNLIYTDGCDSPLFFDYNDSTKTYSISTAEGLTGGFKKAGKLDLIMGHYVCTYMSPKAKAYYESCKQSTDDIIKVDEFNFWTGKTNLMFGEKISIEYNKYPSNIKYLGYGAEQLTVTDNKDRDYYYLHHSEQFSRNGCYDCWITLGGSKNELTSKYERVLEDGARNFLFIFGKDKEEWEYISYRSSSTSSNHSSSSYSSNSSTSSYSSSSSSSSSSASFAEINKWLDSYEQCVNKYISFLKKANNDDISATAEYFSFLDKMNELTEKLSAVEGDMSTAQTSRYLKISQKLVEASESVQSW